VIKTFRDRDTERVANDERTRAFSADVQKSARRKLAILDTATSLNDLRSPPGNRLEKLTRDREGQHSIRVNDQFRLCFHWADGDAYDVEIVDYHD
jgi:proteic killer suppression protein